MSCVLGVFGSWSREVQPLADAISGTSTAFLLFKKLWQARYEHRAIVIAAAGVVARDAAELREEHGQ